MGRSLLKNSDEQKFSGKSARLNMTINALLATHTCADPIQRDLADGLCRHWLAICHGYCEISASDDLDDSRVLN